MKIKKTTIAFLLLSVILLFAIVVSVYFILGSTSTEIKVTKEFIEVLQSENAIDNSVNANKMEYKPLKTELNNNSNIKYTVATGNYGVDLDKDYNVIGFSKKEIKQVNSRSIAIKEEMAITLAEEYIKSISNEEIKFKEIRKPDDDMAQFYTVVFYKFKDGYPYYDYEIVAKINKITGELDGYSNSFLNDIKHTSDINIKYDKANEIANEYFSKLNIKVDIKQEPLLAYVKTKDDNRSELAYIFTVEINSKEILGKKNKLFISANSGEVISIGNDELEKKEVR